MIKLALVVLPALTVAVIAVGLLITGVPSPVVAAQLRGGATEGARSLSWTVEIGRRHEGLQGRAQLERVNVNARCGADQASWSGPVVDGLAYPQITLQTPCDGEVAVSITAGETTLAAGRVNLARAAWSAGAARLGGWIPGRTTGTLTVRIAPEMGVFAVPFEGPLLLEVSDQSGPRAARVRFEPSGAEITPATIETDAGGRARVTVRPLEHAVELRILAEVRGATDEPQVGEWFGALHVVPGALTASLTGSTLQVTSPIPRSVAYLSVVTERERIFGARLSLSPDDRGGAAGAVDLPSALPAEPTWAVVSTEADLASMAIVGWPLVAAAPAAPGEPRFTFAPRDRLLLDGFLGAEALEAERVGRVRRGMSGFVVCALLLIALLLHLRIRASAVSLDQHLEQAGKSGESLRTGAGITLPFMVAIACLALGFGAMALLVLMKL